MWYSKQPRIVFEELSLPGKSENQYRTEDQSYMVVSGGFLRDYDSAYSDTYFNHNPLTNSSCYFVVTICEHIVPTYTILVFQLMVFEALLTSKPDKT